MEYSLKYMHIGLKWLSQIQDTNLERITKVPNFEEISNLSKWKFPPQKLIILNLRT